MPFPPTNPPFDLYAIGPGTTMGSILTYSGVTTQGTGFLTDGPTSDLIISSGGLAATTDSAVFLAASVPDAWTLEFNLLESELPPNFSMLPLSHVFIGGSDPSGVCAGLFISQQGLAYTGAVHFDGSGNMVLDTPVQDLPDSQLLVEQGTYWTFRIATDLDTGTTYIYVTRTSDLPVVGHQLRYVLPAIPSSTAAHSPSSETVVSIRGTVASASEIFLDTYSLGTGLIIPNLPPRADAGQDQSVKTCTVILLDGSASFDPEGANLGYQWRLLDTPLGSQFIFDGLDGETFPLVSPTGFTNLFCSSSLGTLNAETPISAGDVLIVGGIPYTATGTGTGAHGFYVQITGFDLPDSLPGGTAFKYVLQHGISNPTGVKATFYPDVPGLYKFDLTVFDGNLFSFPAETVVNVTESPVPRGVTPDLSFLWGYLSDFWKLLEDPERINIFWGGLAQIAAAELLNLWQVEYSKSLRDIQRTWQRKWLRYALGMQEDPLFIEQTTVRAVYGGIESSSLAITGASIGGQYIDVVLPPSGAKYRITISGAGVITPGSIANQIAAQLQALNTAFSTTLIMSLAGTQMRVRIDAPFAFSIANTSNLTLFSTSSNGALQGTAGTLPAAQSYKVERSLQGIAIQQGDFLVLGDMAYRIARVTSDPSDSFPLQRVTTLDPIPIGAVPAVWAISGQAVSQTLDFWNGLVANGDSITFEVITTANGSISYFTSTAFGASQELTGTLAVDASPVGFFLSQPSLYEVYLYNVTRRHYTPIDPLVVDVPYLQEVINNTDDAQVLRRNVDFFTDTFRGGPCLRFIVGSPSDVWQGGVPPDHMWAETTYLDNKPVIEANFGIPAAFTLDDLSQLPSNVDYLSTVRGLWYAYLNGPTLFNLRVGTQILLGLPFAEEAGTIVEIRDDFSNTNGRILVQDSGDAEVVRSYSFPHSLAVETNPTTGIPYAVGDAVTQFAPLVQGVEVVDWVKNPTWFQGYLEQGSFYEVEKFFTFLVRTSSNAFDLDALLFVQNFILRVKPTYTRPIFVVEEDISDTDISVTDAMSPSGVLYLYEGPCTHGPPWNHSGMFDQPRASGGGFWNIFDGDGIVTPTFPHSTNPVPWAFDKETVCPDYFIGAYLTTTFPGGPFVYDGIFAFDLPLFTQRFTQHGAHGVSGIPGSGSPGYSFGQWPADATGTADQVYVELTGTNGGQNNFNLDIFKNGSLVTTVVITKSNGNRDRFSYPVSIAMTTGDLFEMKIRATGTTGVSVYWHDALIVLATGSDWAFDTTIPPGNYEIYRSM
jgi:hypothetical protein